jgi:iron complex outermembrane recepter protein
MRSIIRVPRVAAVAAAAGFALHAAARALRGRLTPARGLAWAAVLSLATVTPTRAQTLTDSTVVPIEGVTVTGTRTPETILRTPAAVSIVSKDRIASTREISLADGLARVPGVFVQSRGGAQDVRVTIRGYGARGSGERSNSGNMRGIRVLTDGIPITEPDGRTSLEFVDLGGTERVEILRSNGSVLYGNAAGGVINLRTKTDFDSPFLDLSQLAGGYGFLRSQVFAGYTLGRARGTVSVYNSKFDGWRKHSGSATTSIQNRLMSPLDDNTRLGLLLDYVSNFNRYPGPLTQAQFDADPAQGNATFITRDERRFNRVGRAGLTLERDLPGKQRLTVASWVEPKVLQRSERNRFRDFTRYHVGGNATYQLQTALASGWQGLWTAGGDEQYQDGTIQFYNLLPGGTRSTTVFANKREGANSAGGFVQGEVRNEQWSVRVAARYDNLWYISEDRVAPELNATKHFTQVTPKGSIARTFEHHTIYAAVGGGVESPAFNEIDPPPPYDVTTSLNPFLKPMKSTSYELGAKGTLVDERAGVGHVAYDVALYNIDVTDDIVPFDGGGFFYTVGKSRRRGVELGLNWVPVPALTFDGALTLSHNEYLDYTNDVSQALGRTFNGNDVAGLPAGIFDSELRWRVAPGLSVAGTYKYIGKSFADDANLASARAASLVGAEAEYGRATPFGFVKLFVAGDNLTDERYVASVFINGVRSEYYEPGLPANVSAGVTVSLR